MKSRFFFVITAPVIAALFCLSADLPAQSSAGQESLINMISSSVKKGRSGSSLKRPFSGIYADIDKSQYRYAEFVDRVEKGYWALLQEEDPRVSLDSVRMISPFIKKEFQWDTKEYNLGKDSPLDRIAAGILNQIKCNSLPATLINQGSVFDETKPGTLTRVFCFIGIIGWAKKSTQTQSYMLGAASDFTKWSKQAKITEETAPCVWYLTKAIDLTLDQKADIVLNLKQNGAPEWLTELMGGHLSLERAWAARGDGAASTVTASGWKEFEVQLKHGEKQLTNAAKLNPKCHLPYIDLCTVYMGNGTIQQCVDCYRKSLAVCPDDPDTLGQLSLAL